jgi:hypothetical protein
VYTIPERVNELLDEYFNLVDSKLPDLLEGFYIYGSISIGAFDYGFSDVDFISVVKRNVTETDIDTLKKVHRDIKRKFPMTDLMGMYVMENDLEGKNNHKKICPCFIGGKFQGLNKFETNSIDAYQIKKYGITIKGKEISKYSYNVDWDILIHNMVDNLNTYWVRWKNRCEKFSSIFYIGLLLNVSLVEWGVLGVSRLYYTFREKDITSKVGAGEYALKNVPQKWHKIINEAMRLRKGIKKTYYNSIFERRRDALDYIDFIISESNSLFKD